ncbi:MAG: serine hydrolase, partial [Verrucomicrobiales bacterium]|nr:serine hydrolase [Verrucomicrobiales bacterium]
MKPDLFLTFSIAISTFALTAQGQQPANGLAPEITDLNAEDVSYALEAKLPDLETPYISAEPDDKKNGIQVATLTNKVAAPQAILKFASQIADGDHGEINSFLLMHNGALVFESYFRRGRANYPHYQMSITKSYTAVALGRAIQLGHLKMDDLDKPVVSFLAKLDREKLVDGAEAITLAEALNMHSGVRIEKEVAAKLIEGSRRARRSAADSGLSRTQRADSGFTARLQISERRSLDGDAGDRSRRSRNSSRISRNRATWEN